ncbi:MAG: type III secretion system export apparatus subunit SctR [Desulfobacterales bacterium]|nr:type III secretion system export apparatus subunit SctR [Desulfobacterales bacterium]
MQTFSIPDPLYLVVLLIGLSLAPFIAIMVTSYLKFTVVLSLIRNALGIQQIPPNMVINGLAIILTIYVMAPIFEETGLILSQSDLSKKDIPTLKEAAIKAKEPIRHFLLKHCHEKERVFFMKTAKSLWPENKAATLKSDDLIVLVPSFTVSELTTSFEIGFLLYLPFIAIDLVVSNILLAMGMMMVSPMTISLPFKLLLFVLLDGWTRLIHGLVLTYR